MYKSKIPVNPTKSQFYSEAVGGPTGLRIFFRNILVKIRPRKARKHGLISEAGEARVRVLAKTAGSWEKNRFFYLNISCSWVKSLDVPKPQRSCGWSKFLLASLSYPHVCFGVSIVSPYRHGKSPFVVAYIPLGESASQPNGWFEICCIVCLMNCHELSPLLPEMNMVKNCHPHDHIDK